MRTFEIYNASRRKHKACAQLTYDSDRDDVRIEIDKGTSIDDLPLMLGLFAQKGQFEVGDKWARRWIEERIPPQSRQNLGEILRANGLSEYDPIELLSLGKGRSAQDDFLIRETTAHVEYATISLDSERAPLDNRGSTANRWCAILGPKIAEHRKSQGMTQRDLAEKTGIDQAAISRIESGRANPTLNSLEALVEGVGFSLSVKIL